MAIMIRGLLLAPLLATALAATAEAATSWNETSHGDLSNDGLSPTLLAVSNGSNQVLGTTGDGGQGIDRDYFSFIVPDGSVLASLMLLGATNVSGSVSFLALQAGPQVTVLPSGAGADHLLGFMHYGNDLVGTNLLPTLISAGGGLPSGTYSLWVQETGGPATYGFDVVLSAVPEPGVAEAMLAGLLALSGWARRKGRSRS